MALFFHQYRNYLFLFIAIAGLLTQGACGGRDSGNKRQSKYQSDTLASLTKSSEKTEPGTMGYKGYKVFQTISPQMCAGCKQVTTYILEDARLQGLSGELVIVLHYTPQNWRLALIKIF